MGEECKEILDGMLTIPTIGRKEQDTDISSLYSMNSEDETPTVFYEDEEQQMLEKKCVQKSKEYFMKEKELFVKTNVYITL